MEDKNLDRLFQEQLKNLEAKPLPRVWNAIEGKLQKKKRRVVPIWWLSGGVAATLIIGLLIFSTSKDKILKDKIEKNPLLISTPKKDFENTLPETQGSDTLFNIYEEKTIIAEEKIVPKKSKSTNFKQQKDKNNEGVLIMTTTGYPIFDNAGGIIEIPEDVTQISIANDGTISGNGQQIAKIGIYSFNPSNMQRHENGLYSMDIPAEITLEAKIHQGFIENSNVNAVQTLTDMITVQRAYEAGKKIMDSEDQRIRGAISRLGQNAR